MNNEAESAWRKYAARTGTAKPIPGTRDWNDEKSAFTAGVAWQASRPITDEQVGAVAVYFGCDLSDARAALEAAAGVQS